MRDFFIVVILLFVFSCTEKDVPTREELIANEVQLKADNYLKERYDKCLESNMADIEFEVDSMMYYLVKKIKGNDEEMPQKPIRPDRLVDTIKLDTFIIEKD